MHSLAPCIFTVVFSWEKSGAPVGCVVSFFCHDLVCLFLDVGIQAVQGLVSTIEIDFVVVGRWKVGFQIVEKGLGNGVVVQCESSWPVGRQAGGSSKDLWVFTDGVQRDQASHAAAHDVGMFSICMDGIVLINVGLYFFYQKLQVAI